MFPSKVKFSFLTSKCVRLLKVIVHFLRCPPNNTNIPAEASFRLIRVPLQEDLVVGLFQIHKSLQKECADISIILIQWILYDYAIIWQNIQILPV